jgi:hypothetical protein
MLVVTTDKLRATGGSEDFVHLTKRKLCVLAVKSTVM